MCLRQREGAYISLPYRHVLLTGVNGPGTAAPLPSLPPSYRGRSRQPSLSDTGTPYAMRTALQYALTLHRGEVCGNARSLTSGEALAREKGAAETGGVDASAGGAPPLQYWLVSPGLQCQLRGTQTGELRGLPGAAGLAASLKPPKESGAAAGAGAAAFGVWLHRRHGQK
jgi:hypothetical protein